MAALVVRRALGLARDARAVSERLRAAGVTPGPALAAALSSDAWGVALLAERGGAAVGVAVVRFLRAPGAAAEDVVSLAVVDVLHGPDDDPDVREALAAAARAEAEAREATRVVVLAEGASPTAPPPARALATVELAAGVRAELFDAKPREAVTRWSGAQAFRTRWRDDLSGAGWSSDDCVGPAGDDGDALRFDRATRALREAWLTRPAALRIDEAALAAACALPASEAVVRLADDAPDFALAPMDESLFDLSLGAFVALRDGAAASLVARGGAGWRAVAVSDEVALLFEDDAWRGWRVRDPASCARPMGWPEMREPGESSLARMGALRALLYDWMVIDASPRVAPAEAASPEDVEHMVALRERARALAASSEGDRDAVAGVARDVAAHVHWSWGFYRVSE